VNPAIRWSLGWSLAVGVAFQLVGLGHIFLRLTVSLLVLGIVLSGMAIMLGKKVGQTVAPVLLAGIGLIVIPSFAAGVLKNLWAAQPLVLVGAVLIGLMWGAVRFRPTWPKFFPLRSGGGKAVRLPRRWRP
jgi:hypothetical protein